MVNDIYNAKNIVSLCNYDIILINIFTWNSIISIIILLLNYKVDNQPEKIG